MLERASRGTSRSIPWRDRQASAHEILGVEAAASPETIRRAYLKLIQAWHPDRFPNDPMLRREAERAAKRINEAYEALCPPRRARWRPIPSSPRGRPSTSAARDYTGYGYASPSWEGRGSVRQLIMITVLLLTWLLASVLLFYALAEWL